MAAGAVMVQSLLDNGYHQAIVRGTETERLSALLGQTNQPLGFLGWHIASVSWA